ncbi:MAG: hypothetical protein WAM85_14495, partial [Terracidiphilus sp.]
HAPNPNTKAVGDIMHFDPSTLTSPPVIIGLIAVVLILVIGIALAIRRHRRTTAELRTRFGTEYDQALRESRDSRKAEARLMARVERVRHFTIRDLTETERARYLADWEAVQSHFVDRPRGAVTEADELVSSLLQARGYPKANFDQRVADISVDHARLVEPYRSACAISVRASRNEASTEELRTAMIHYRALFEELLQVKTPSESRALV